MSEKHIGSSIDDFMKEEGIPEAAQTKAIEEVKAWQQTISIIGKESQRNELDFSS